jgi:acetyl-CoA carboxylase carboxyltransferase component
MTRPELEALQQQRARTLDGARAAALAKRQALGKRSARENLADLCDPDSFIEYGALALAAQRSRRSLDELQRETPADGLVAGIATVNAAAFGAARARCVVLHYDYSVLAGTQGYQNHRKTDRMVQLAAAQRLPVIFFVEGGGGRPGDTDLDRVMASGLEVSSFFEFARLSGQVPLIGINTGRCFAGNAAFYGCCDLTIATRDANVGMSGPAMIAAGGLGQFRPEEIGPSDQQSANGVLDVVVDDEAAAVRVAQQYLGYFQGALPPGAAPDPQRLREVLPENRRLAYDVRRVIEALADTDTVLELRRAFAPNLVTALIRIGGHPLGLIANNPAQLAGAIDSAAADKAARFLQLCDAHGLPVLSLCDTPGFMVGPAAEKTATVRHASRLFVVGAQLRVPIFGVVLRKAYGLGAQAMLGGHLKRPQFTVAWPTGEFGPMGLEGAVTLGFRRELEAAAEGPERERLFRQLVDQRYEQGKAASVATYFEIDDVIDPAESRRWILDGLRSWAPEAPGRRRFIDPW